MKAFLAWYSLNWRPDSIILMIFSYNKMLTNCLRKIQTFNTADLSFFSVLLFASFSGSCKFFKDVCRHVFRFNRSTIFCCRPFPGAPSALSCDLSQVVSHTAQLSALLKSESESGKWFLILRNSQLSWKTNSSSALTLLSLCLNSKEKLK